MLSIFSSLSSQDVASIILHIVFIATFIIIFFFTYGLSLEEEVVKQQMSYITNDLVSSFGPLASTIGPILKSRLSTMDPSTMNAADEKALANNSSLRNKSFLMLFVIIIIGSTSIFYISRRYNFSIKEIVFTNIVSLFVLGMTYFLFAKYYLARYRSMDSNFVKKKFLESVTSLKN